MLRRNVTKLALASIAVVAMLALSASDAKALGWRAYGSSGGSYGSWGSGGGSYGSYGSGGSYGSWGSGGSYGSWGYRTWRPIVRWRMTARAARYYGGWGSYGGSYGSWGSSGGYVVGYGSGGSGGGSSGGAYSTMRIDGGDVQVMPMDATVPAVNDGASTNSALLNVLVPDDAKVYVNGLATTSTGETRRYVSNGLESGFSYTYELRAERVVDGKTVTETKTVKLKAGEQAQMAFNFSDEADAQVAGEPVRTSLTVIVPEDAKVYLSGNATQSSGEVREFSTTKLAAGQEWSDYTIRAEVDRNGRTVAKELKISLHGGESKRIEIDLDAPQVASNATSSR